jgi:holo-ACP synthase
MNEQDLLVIESIMLAREERYFRQRSLLKTFKLSLITYSVNFPGSNKNTELAHFIFSSGLADFEKAGIIYVYREIRFSPAGPGAYFIVDAEPLQLKQKLIALEESCAYGRLYDFDLFKPDGSLISRRDLSLPPRKCLICNGDWVVCRKENRHSTKELLAAIEAIHEKPS